MTSLRLPSPDRLLSSRTGYTRETWIALADQLLDALTPWFSPGAARVDLPGRGSWSGAACDGLEGFARSFLLAAFRIAATEGKGCEALIDRYARGLVEGTGGQEAWPRLTPCSQQMVEAAAIAVGLHESRAWLWDRLDGPDQQKVVDWLSGFVGSRTWDNNWRLFQVVGEQFLASVGAPYSQDDIDSGLDRIEDWYVGDGWYSDGGGQNFDHYIGWAMHLYPGLWTRMAGTAADDRLTVYRERIRRFLEDAVHLVGADGAPVHHGRSLCYRMAAAAPYWMGMLLDASPLSPGQTRRLCSGMLRHFVDHGVPDERGLLSLGWHHHFLPVTQSYSGPGSPYWASKGFLGLLLPAEHPVWTDREAALPIDEDDQLRAMPAPGFVLQGTRHDGIVRLLNHGSDHVPNTDPDPPAAPESPADHHYDRLAYSSRTAPELSPDRIDNHVALVGEDGAISCRGRIRRIAVAGRSAASWWNAWLPGQNDPWRIEVASVVHGRLEVRCVLVDGPGGVMVRHGGYTIADRHRPDVESTGILAHAVRPDRLSSVVVGLHGYDEAGVRRDLDTNAFGPHSATPYLVRRSHPGGPLLLVSAVVLSGDTVWPEALAESVEVEVDGLHCIIRMVGGHEEEVVMDGGGTTAAAGPTA